MFDILDEPRVMEAIEPKLRTRFSRAANLMRKFFDSIDKPWKESSDIYDEDEEASQASLLIKCIEDEPPSSSPDKDDKAAQGASPKGKGGKAAQGASSDDKAAQGASSDDKNDNAPLVSSSSDKGGKAAQGASSDDDDSLAYSSDDDANDQASSSDDDDYVDGPPDEDPYVRFNRVFP
jgi:hypothetical protein